MHLNNEKSHCWKQLPYTTNHCGDVNVASGNRAGVCSDRCFTGERESWLDPVVLRSERLVVGNCHNKNKDVEKHMGVFMRRIPEDKSEFLKQMKASTKVTSENILF